MRRKRETEMKTRSGKGFPRDWPHRRRARGSQKARRVLAAGFLISARMASPADADVLVLHSQNAAGVKVKRAQTRAILERNYKPDPIRGRHLEARPNSIKRFENACNCFPDCPWGALLLVAFFTRRKYHCRTMESCTPKRAACSFLLVRARLSLFYIQSNVRSSNASLNKAANVKMITVNAKYFVHKNWKLSVNVELCR